MIISAFECPRTARHSRVTEESATRLFIYFLHCHEIVLLDGHILRSLTVTRSENRKRFVQLGCQDEESGSSYLVLSPDDVSNKVKLRIFHPGTLIVSNKV